MVRVPLASDVPLLLQPCHLLLDEREVPGRVLHGTGPRALPEETGPPDRQTSTQQFVCGRHRSHRYSPVVSRAASYLLAVCL